MAAIIHYSSNTPLKNYDEYIVIVDEDPEDVTDEIRKLNLEPNFKVIGVYELNCSGCLPCYRSLHT